MPIQKQKSLIAIELEDGSPNEEALDAEFVAFTVEMIASPVPVASGNVARVLLGAVADGEETFPIAALTREALMLARVLEGIEGDDALALEVTRTLRAKLAALEIFVARLPVEPFLWEHGTAANAAE
jgi:hypothetical protein